MKIGKISSKYLLILILYFFIWIKVYFGKISLQSTKIKFEVPFLIIRKNRGLIAINGIYIQITFPNIP